MQPYDEAETQEYLAQRLEGAGQGIELFSAEQIADIHLASGGWPGAINLLAREALIDAMLAQRGAEKHSSFGFKLPVKHLVALLVVAGGVAAAWMMQERTESVPVAPISAQLPLGQEPVAVDAAAPNVAPDVAGPKIDFAGSSQPLPLPLLQSRDQARPSRRPAHPA